MFSCSLQKCKMCEKGKDKENDNQISCRKIFFKPMLFCVWRFIIPKMSPKASQFYPICFAHSCLLFTYVIKPKQRHSIFISREFLNLLFWKCSKFLFLFFVCHQGIMKIIWVQSLFALTLKHQAYKTQLLRFEPVLCL